MSPWIAATSGAGPVSVCAKAKAGMRQRIAAKRLRVSMGYSQSIWESEFDCAGELRQEQLQRRLQILHFVQDDIGWERVETSHLNGKNTPLGCANRFSGALSILLRLLPLLDERQDLFGVAFGFDILKNAQQ